MATVWTVELDQKGRRMVGGVTGFEELVRRVKGSPFDGVDCCTVGFAVLSIIVS